MCGQEGQPNHRLILLLLKLHISRLGECPIAQGCRNLPRTILKTQQLCTFLLYKNIPSYVWKYWLGKGGVATSNPSSSCCKIKSCAPSSPGIQNELFLWNQKAIQGSFALVIECLVQIPTLQVPIGTSYLPPFHL